MERPKCLFADFEEESAQISTVWRGVWPREWWHGRVQTAPWLCTQARLVLVVLVPVPSAEAFGRFVLMTCRRATQFHRNISLDMSSEPTTFGHKTQTPL